MLIEAQAIGIPAGVPHVRLVRLGVRALHGTGASVTRAVEAMMASPNTAHANLASELVALRTALEARGYSIDQTWRERAEHAEAELIETRASLSVDTDALSVAVGALKEIEAWPQGPLMVTGNDAIEMRTVAIRALHSLGRGR